MRIWKKGDIVNIPSSVKMCPVCGGSLLSGQYHFMCFDCCSVFKIMDEGQSDVELKCEYIGVMEWMKKDNFKNDTNTAYDVAGY